MIFEMSRVFRRQEGAQPQEAQMLGLAVTGGVGGQHWGESTRAFDLYDLVGVLDLTADRLHRQALSVNPAPVPFCHPGKSAEISLGGESIGIVGEVHPGVLAAFEVSQVVTLAEIDVDRLIGQGMMPPQYQPIPRFPAVTRDLSIILDAAVPAGEILTDIKGSHSNLLREVRLFDIYAGKPIPAGKKSLTFALTYRADDRTLTDDEVNAIQTRVIERIRQKFAAQLRGQGGDDDHGSPGN